MSKFDKCQSGWRKNWKKKKSLLGFWNVNFDEIVRGKIMHSEKLKWFGVFLHFDSGRCLVHPGVFLSVHSILIIPVKLQTLCWQYIHFFYGRRSLCGKFNLNPLKLQLRLWFIHTQEDKSHSVHIWPVCDVVCKTTSIFDLWFFFKFAFSKGLLKWSCNCGLPEVAGLRCRASFSH